MIQHIDSELGQGGIVVRASLEGVLRWKVARDSVGGPWRYRMRSGKTKDC